MKSPFPGMDPSLEARWSDVHTKLITFVGEALQAQLPRSLRARSEERVLIEAAEEPQQSYRSNVAVVDIGGASRLKGSAAAVATVEPVVVQYYNEPVVDRFIQIIDVTNGNRVVTVRAKWITDLNPGSKALAHFAGSRTHEKLEQN